MQGWRLWRARDSSSGSVELFTNSKRNVVCRAGKAVVCRALNTPCCYTPSLLSTSVYLCVLRFPQCAQVASQRQAADEAIHRHVYELKHRLLDSPKTKPTTKSSAAAGGGTQQDTAAADTNKHSTSTESGQLSKAVLVIVSDDRGFARTIAGWLARGGVGAVIVGERGAEGWQQPLKSSGCSRDRVGDVAHVDWRDVMAAAVVPLVTDLDSDDDEWMVDDDLESVFRPGWFL